MKNSDGNSTRSKGRGLIYFEEGKVKAEIPLSKSYCQSVREDWFSDTLNKLIEITQDLYDQNKHLRAENARLSRRPKKPVFKPSKQQESEISKNEKSERNKKKKKTTTPNPNKKDRTIDETITVSLDKPAAGARFKGYQYFNVQELEIKTNLKQYRRARWQLSSGKMIVASLPKEVDGQHFGPQLRQYILYQYYHQRVTQPQLLNQLREWQISISSGQLSHLLNKNKETWHAEKEAILSTALKHSNYIQVDDTGAKHQDKSYYCTQLGNEAFAYFDTRQLKSRLNFLTILQGKETGYCLSQHAIDYLAQYPTSLNWLTVDFLEEVSSFGYFSSLDDWNNFLKSSTLNSVHYQRFTEAAMIGYLMKTKHVNHQLIILSDAARQFKIMKKAACWVHAERILTTFIPKTEQESQLKEQKLKHFWGLYQYIKKRRCTRWFKENGAQRAAVVFDELCRAPSEAKLFHKPLKHLNKLKEELLLAASNTAIPLHNNQSESDIREYVIRRKISGATKSQDGLLCRDTFVTLKKTAQRQRLSYWDYLGDRIYLRQKIPMLCQLVEENLKKLNATVF